MDIPNHDSEDHCVMTHFVDYVIYQIDHWTQENLEYEQILSGVGELKSFYSV